MVRIHDLKTDANADHGKTAKQDVRKEKNSGLLLEKLRVIPETIDVSFRHCIKVDEIIMPVESQIKDLLRQDKGTKQAEHKRVKVLVAGAGRDDTEDQNDGKDVEKYAHHAVVDMYRCVPVVIVSGRAPIGYDAEREEVPVGTKEQIHVYSSHVVEDEFVDDEVDKLRALEADEPLDLRAALDRTLIVDQPTDHELRHDGSLDANPYFLDDVADRARVVLVLLIRGFQTCQCDRK